MVCQLASPRTADRDRAAVRDPAAADYIWNRPAIRAMVVGQMARLPFLVEHGPIVWQGLAAIAAAVAIAVVRRVRARREHRATARELAARTAEVTAPVEGSATVRGTLRGGRAASVSLLIEKTRHHRQHDVGKEPRNRFAPASHHNRTYRREQRP